MQYFAYSPGNAKVRVVDFQYSIGDAHVNINVNAGVYEYAAFNTPLEMQRCCMNHLVTQ